MKTYPRIVAQLALVLTGLAINLSFARQAKAASFIPTGPLAGARAGHTATLLFDGHRRGIPGGPGQASFNGQVGIFADQALVAHPSHSGWRAVPSKPALVLNRSYWPVAASGAVFASSDAISTSLIALNVRTASSA
jgi:hypothetical protein